MLSYKSSAAASPQEMQRLREEVETREAAAAKLQEQLNGAQKAAVALERQQEGRSAELAGKVRWGWCQTSVFKAFVSP